MDLEDWINVVWSLVAIVIGILVIVLATALALKAVLALFSGV